MRYEWFGEVPAHWEMKRLKFLSHINPSPSEIKHLKNDYEVSFVPMDAVKEYGGLHLGQIRSLEELRNGFSYFREYDVLIAKITPCFENGKGSLAKGLKNGIAFGTTELHVVRPTPNLEMCFLFFLTISHAFRKLGASEMYGAGGQKRVSTEFVRDFLTLLPPINEQNYIARFLEKQTKKIDGLIAAKRELLALLKEKRQAVITHAVTKGLNPNVKLKPSGINWLRDVPENWDITHLNRMIQVLDCKHRTVSFVDDGIPIASIREVHGFEIDLNRVKQTTYKEFVDLIEGGRQPRIGDIIYSRNATVGDAALVTSSQTFCMGQDVCLLRTSVHFPEYLAFLLHSSALRKQLESLIVGSIFRRINVSQIKSFWICTPPLKEQKAIAKFLNSNTKKIDLLISEIEKAITTLQEYRIALISAAVTGKIDVRNEVEDGAAL